jgi:hypothetical protein
LRERRHTGSAVPTPFDPNPVSSYISILKRAAGVNMSLAEFPDFPPHRTLRKFDSILIDLILCIDNSAPPPPSNAESTIDPINSYSYTCYRVLRSDLSIPTTRINNKKLEEQNLWLLNQNSWFSSRKLDQRSYQDRFICVGWRKILDC